MPPVTPSSTYRWVMLFGVWLTYFCFGLSVSSLAPLIRPITEDLAMSYAAMGSILGAWQLVYIGTALPCGALIDRFGLRRSLLLASVLMGASCLLRSQAQDYLTLLLAVALFGFGGPLVSIGAPKLISLWFEGPQKGLAMGIYVTGPALGSIAALSLTNSVAMPLLGHEWRNVLLSYGVVVLLSGGVWWLINRDPGSREVEAESLQAPRPPQWHLFLQLSRIRSVQYVLLISIGIFLYNHGLGNWLHEILMTRGLSSPQAGVWASLPTVIGVFGALLIPRKATPPLRIHFLGGLFLLAGTATLLLQTSSEWTLLLGLVLKGITQGSMMTILLLILMEIPEVGAKNSGSAGGMFFAAAEIGGVLGPLSLGVLSEWTGSFQWALSGLTGTCLLLIFLLTRLPSHSDG
jgi:CP family cyanate transporter-like MFS transporter